MKQFPRWYDTVTKNEKREKCVQKKEKKEGETKHFFLGSRRNPNCASYSHYMEGVGVRVARLIAGART